MKCKAHHWTMQSDVDPNAVTVESASSCMTSGVSELGFHSARCWALAMNRLGKKTRVLLWLLLAVFSEVSMTEHRCLGENSHVMDLATSHDDQSFRYLSISDRLQQLETEFSLTNSGIDNFVRMEENHRIRPALTRMIASEEILIAIKDSLRAFRKAPKNFSVDSEAIALDPVIDSMHVAKGDLTSSYRKLDESRESLLLTDRSINRLAWEAAQLSSLPGLIRLVAFDDRGLLSPVFVQSLPLVDTNRNPPYEIASPAEAIVQMAGPGLEDSSTFENHESVDLGKTIDTQSNSQPDARVTQATVPPQNASQAVVASGPEAEVVELPSNHTGEADLSIEQVVQVPSESNLENTSDMAEANLTPVIVQPPATIRQVETMPVVIAQPPVSSPEPAARVATTWPFVAGEQHAEKVSLNVSNADVRTVFEMLARGYQMNILVASEVKGTVTANIEGLTADETLRGVLKMCNLKYRQEEGLIFIYPSDGLPAESREVRLFPLDFARADALDPAVQGLLSPIGNAYVTQMNSSDNRRTNETIVVVDTPEAIAQIENYILQADHAPRQVMIEAHILEVILKDDMMHGINFDAIIGGDLTVGSFGLADPIATRANPLVFAQIDGSRVDALVDLIETTTDSKTLASPRIMVVNGQHARIQVGQQLGFTVATVTQTSTVQDVQFLDTGVVLDVTPTISRDDMIMLQVKPQVSDGQINPDTLLPEEETREVETSVLLENHRGVVIGGLIQEADRTVIRKLPWLGDVRYVGKLFQRRELERQRSEIVIALVPHIIECGPATERDAVDFDRATSPLLHGPLKRTCRPWEPRLPDTVGQERHLDVNRVNDALTP